MKISADERIGWSSERPRRDGAPPRPPDVSGNCRTLAPTDRMRYSPGSLVVIVGAVSAERIAFAERVVEERGAVLSPARVRALLAGRVPDEQIDERARELLSAAVLKRLQAGQSVVVPAETLDPDERAVWVRAAHAERRPRHLILLDASRDQGLDGDRAQLDELRRALEAGELGREGFQTALRLGGHARSELKRIVFARQPAEH
ncbi:MAG: AAA family ATPase [Solirubrobacteraceae bacterium]